VYRHYCRAVRSLGIKDQMSQYGDTENAMCGGRVEAPPRFLFDSYVTGGESDRSNVRKPCLSDPATRKTIAEQSSAHAASVRKFGLYGTCTAGEAMVCAGTVGEHDVCLGPHCQRRYQHWLRERYETIDRLNTQWGTAYTSFAQCKGMVAAEARKLSNYSPFVDFREFMAEVWADALRLAPHAYREGDPGLRVGYTHSFGSVTLGGTDFYRLAKQADFTWGQEYPECRKDQARFACFMLWRSFCQARLDRWPGL